MGEWHCGYWEFSGSWEGWSAYDCGDWGAGGIVELFVTPATGSTLTVTWYGDSSAYLDWIATSVVTPLLAEGESGAYSTAACYNGVAVSTVADRLSSDGSALRFPGTGCSAAYTSISGGVNGIRYRIESGPAWNSPCGYFVFTGAWIGQSEPLCAATSGNWIEARACTTPGSGTTTTATWQPIDSQGPSTSSVVGTLDYIVEGPIHGSYGSSGPLSWECGRSWGWSPSQGFWPPTHPDDGGRNNHDDGH